MSTDPPIRPVVRRTRPLARALPAAALTCLALAPFWSVFAGHSFSVVPSFQSATYPWAADPSDLPFLPQSDQAESAYPFSVSVGRALREGALPLWEPHSFGGGYPLFSNGLVGALYPPKLLLRGLLSPEQAHDVLVVVHVAAAGLCTYLLLRRGGVGIAGAFLAGVAWMFGSFPMAWVQLDMVLPVFALLPLALYTVDRALRPGSWPWAVAAGWVLAMTLTAGNMVFLWMAYVTAASYGAGLLLVAVLRARSAHEGFPIAQLGRLSLLGAISAGGAAATLLPTVRALWGGGRTPMTYEQLSAGLLMPLATLSRTLSPPPLPLTAERMVEMAWYGLVPLALAVAALLFARCRLAAFGRTSVVVGIAVAVGTPLTWLVFHAVPGMDALRPYSRLLLVIGFGLVVLAGVGLDLVERTVRPRLLVLVPSTPAFRRRTPVVLSAALLVATTGVTVVQLLPFALAINPPLLRDDVHPQFPRTPIIDAIVAADAETPWPSMLLPVALTRADGQWAPRPLAGATSLVFGIDSFGGYDSVVPERTTTVIRLLEGVPVHEALGPAGSGYLAYPVYESARMRWDLVERYGAELVYLPPTFPDGDPGNWGTLGSPARWELLYDGPDGRLFRIPGGDSAPFVVPTQQVVADGPRALTTFTAPQHDPRSVVVVEHADVEAAEVPLLAGGDPRARIHSADRTANGMRVRATLQRPGWLVLPVNWDRGWSAEVDGAAVSLVRANFSRMALQLPAGTSSTVLHYRPPGLALGVALTSVAALLSAAVLLLSVRARRPGGPGITTAAEGRESVGDAPSRTP